MLMKKLFTLSMVLLLAMQVAAQKFEFKYNGEVLADGATLTINAETDMFGELACETNPSSGSAEGLVVAGKNGAYISGSAHLAILEHTFKAKTVQWCMGGLCEPMKSVTELDKTFADAAVPVMFDAFTIRQEGYLLAQLDVTVGGESQTLFIEFSNGQHAGVGQVTVGDGSADVYDMNGRQVMMDAHAADQQTLKPGLYVVKNGSKARKLIVK